MKICFFTKHQINWGSSRERIGVYLSYIKERGHTYEVIYLIPNKLSRIWIGSKRQNLLFNRIYSFWHSRILKQLKLIWLISIAKRFDLILIQKVILLYPLVWILKTRNKNIIFDFDDQCFWRDLGIVQKNRFNFVKKIKFWRSKGIQHPAILRLYSHIIVGNKYLANIAVEIKGKNNVSIIPTSVDCSIYYPRERIRRDGPVMIGWAGSGENHLRHLELLINPFRELLKQTDFTFELVGAMYSKKIKTLFKFLDSRFICIDWVDDHARLPGIIQAFDIGVMPLRDDEDSRGKCAFKVLQYMASGVPVIISPVGINKEIVKDGVNGFLAKDEEEWVKKLLFLISDENLRNRFAKEGRKTVEGLYSLSNTSKLFIDVIERQQPEIG